VDMLDGLGFIYVLLFYTLAWGYDALHALKFAVSREFSDFGPESLWNPAIHLDRSF
jgi:hypothetical protein